MIILENIKKIGNIISAIYYYPNGDNDKGYLEYNIDLNHFSKTVLNKEDTLYHSNLAPFKTQKVFKNMVDFNQFPNEYILYWH